VKGNLNQKGDSLPDLEEGDIIEALGDFSHHFIDCRPAPCHAESELCSTPVLLDKIEFAVILGVKIAYMPAGLDQLLKLGLLRGKIWLQKKYAPATAVHVVRGTMKTRALGKKIRGSPGP
jgi:hypothetical protein